MKKWKVLIVDDEKDIHYIIERVIKKEIFQGREIECINAFSAKEGIEKAKENQDIALIFLDVQMETKQAGLDAVFSFLKVLKIKIPIFIVTGQQEIAPELEVSKQYPIARYISKSSINANFLRSCLFNGLSQASNLFELEYHIQSLEVMKNLHAFLHEGSSEKPNLINSYNPKLSDLIKKLCFFPFQDTSDFSCLLFFVVPPNKEIQFEFPKNGIKANFDQLETYDKLFHVITNTGKEFEFKDNTIELTKEDHEYSKTCFFIDNDQIPCIENKKLDSFFSFRPFFQKKINETDYQGNYGGLGLIIKGAMLNDSRKNFCQLFLEDLFYSFYTQYFIFH